MLHIKFQASLQTVSEEEDFFKIFSMYNYGSILGPLARRHLGPGNLHLTKLGKIFLSNVTCLSSL